MKNRLNELMRAYRSRPAAKEEQSLWQFVRERDPELFSHHPDGPRFREHVWNFGGLYFCKGCVVTFAGAGFGGAVFAGFRWLHLFGTAEVALIFLLLLMPTIVAQLFKLPRWFRHLSRFLLGFLIVSALFMLFVTDSWLVRGLIVASYFAGKIPMERMRNRENREIASARAKRDVYSPGE